MNIFSDITPLGFRNLLHKRSEVKSVGLGFEFWVLLFGYCLYPIVKILIPLKCLRPILTLPPLHRNRIKFLPNPNNLPRHQIINARGDVYSSKELVE